MSWWNRTSLTRQTPPSTVKILDGRYRLWWTIHKWYICVARRATSNISTIHFDVMKPPILVYRAAFNQQFVIFERIPLVPSRWGEVLCMVWHKQTEKSRGGRKQHWVLYTLNFSRSSIFRGRFTHNTSYRENQTKSRRREIGVQSFPIALWFGWRVGNSAVEAPVKFKNNAIISTSNRVVSGVCTILRPGGLFYKQRWT